MEPRLLLPADWEHHPELVQALQVLVKGAVRSLRTPTPTPAPAPAPAPAEPGRPGAREKREKGEGRPR